MPPRCSFCSRPYTSHAENCLALDIDRKMRRHAEARAYFNSMTRMQRVLALAVGAADKGATLHWHGVLP
jgi:hypothetical protein